MENVEKRSAALAFLQQLAIETEAGGYIERYSDEFSVTPEARPIFEKFLYSKLPDNRAEALRALVLQGGFTGYEGDAVLLHFESRLTGSQDEYLTIRILQRLDKLGSAQARRILEILEADPYIKEMWSDPP